MKIDQYYGNGRSNGGFSLYGILSVVFVFVLLIQLCRSMAIDTFGLTGTRLDLAGFAICHAIGAALIARAVISRRLMADVLLLCVLLISYIATVVANTAIDTSLLAMFLSRYGILNWLLLGVGTAAAASYIHLPIASPQARLQKRLFLSITVIVGIILTLFSATYLSYPVFSLSYQSVANNLILILLILMIFTQVIWGGKVPIPVVVGLLVIGTLAVTAVARMQSTSIVGFWMVGLLVYFWAALSKLTLKYKIIAFASLSFVAIIYLKSDLFTQTLESTRFAVLLGGGGLSSLDGRLELMSDFGRQFAVGPVFGHFSAEVMAGSGIGNYPHSLLSFLTHTGLVGTALLCVVLFLSYSRRFPVRRLSQPDVQQLMFMSAILALGTAYTFMTWSVFWFMLGFMCKMPIPKAAGEAR
ncbi:hypothetical protein [Brevundimonas denitrificans]|nr:hypothetical protein [Brevundimonas denitrificans]